MGEKRKLRKSVKQSQLREWDRLLDAVRRSLARPAGKSIEVEGILDEIRRSIKLVGPSKWDRVPWAVYVSGLYAVVIGPAHEHALPGALAHAAAVATMREHTNALDVQDCIDLANALRRDRA